MANSEIVEQMNRELLQELNEANRILQEKEKMVVENNSQIEQYHELYMRYLELQVQLNDDRMKSQKFEEDAKLLREMVQDLQAQNAVLAKENQEFANLLAKTRACMFNPAVSPPAAEPKIVSNGFGAVGNGFSTTSTTLSPVVAQTNGFDHSRNNEHGSTNNLMETRKPTQAYTVANKPKAQSLSGSVQNLTLDQDHQTHSLMINNLFQGLCIYDLENYFKKFGTILGTTQPAQTHKFQDGKKYMFIKFKHTASVDRAVAIGTHDINGVRVFVKKGKDF